ncbi:hypothetical protein BPUTEOMOX_878 [methanotrophic endosymbiont of Bathymodiolus puteoserpentis (Logatchev)]|jgi:hypothetical protein|nr:hypothetical protein BPUTEOMOX_878 [methanotrophic endosymbiont of Bathymodiolus puteoserpentis (Logatchev)]
MGKELIFNVHFNTRHLENSKAECFVFKWAYIFYHFKVGHNDWGKLFTQQ